MAVERIQMAGITIGVQVFGTDTMQGFQETIHTATTVTGVLIGNMAALTTKHALAAIPFPVGRDVQHEVSLEANLGHAQGR